MIDCVIRRGLETILVLERGKYRAKAAQRENLTADILFAINILEKNPDILFEHLSKWRSELDQRVLALFFIIGVKPPEQTSKRLQEVTDNVWYDVTST